MWPMPLLTALYGGGEGVNLRAAPLPQNEESRFIMLIVEVRNRDLLADFFQI